jgi:hypothetical protein
VPAAVLTPFTRSRARQVAPGKWVKRLLPVGSISYQGRRLDFDVPYLSELASAYNAKAYDYVPLQLAGDDNKHTNDVERFGGKISDMTVDLNGPDGPGLYVGLAPTERGERVLKDNPDVGVSARIVEDYDRSDGRYFPRAIQHVLATHDPRIPGLGGWQAVEAANDVQVTIDLSSMQFAGEQEGTGDMPEFTDQQRARLAKLLDVDEQTWQQVIAGLTAPELSPEELAQLGQGGGDGELSDAELDELITAAQELETMGLLDEPEPAGAGATLAADNTMMALELTAARADAQQHQLNEVQAHLDRERWLAERRRFIHDLSIPAHIVDEAQPLLHGAGHVVELSNGQAVDAGSIMRKVLDLTGQTLRGLGLDMDAVELGSPLDEPEQHGQAAQARADVISLFKRQTGIA